MAVYKRIDRLPDLIDQLKNQTYQRFNLNIWNNSGKKLNINFSDKRLQVINSPNNVGSIGRFRLVPHTKGKCIIFIDDDLELQNDFIEYMYKKWKEDPDSIQGWFTRIFVNGYWSSIPYNIEDTEVDYVGTGGMVLSRNIFDKEQSLQNPDWNFIKVEDLYLCYIAWKNGIKCYAIEPHCKIIPDGYDQYKDLLEYKEQALNKLIEMGWQTKNLRS